MRKAWLAYRAEAMREGLFERQRDHWSPHGWYYEAVLAFVLRWKIADETLGSAAKLMLDLDNPIKATSDSASRIFGPNALGVIVNLANVHWVSFKLYHGQLWLLDSHPGWKRFLREDPGEPEGAPPGTSREHPGEHARGSSRETPQGHPRK